MTSRDRFQFKARSHFPSTEPTVLRFNRFEPIFDFQEPIL
jgi:hypothetical protein